jgi:hypothetical protein
MTVRFLNQAINFEKFAFLRSCMKNIFKKPSMLRLRPRDTMKVCSTCPVLSLSKYMIGYWKKKGDEVQKERERERER